MAELTALELERSGESTRFSPHGGAGCGGNSTSARVSSSDNDVVGVERSADCNLDGSCRGAQRAGCYTFEVIPNRAQGLCTVNVEDPPWSASPRGS